jgi:hypothetical protein
MDKRQQTALAIFICPASVSALSCEKMGAFCESATLASAYSSLKVLRLTITIGG